MTTPQDKTRHTPTPYFIEQEGYSIVTRDGIQVATTEYALKRDYSESKCNTAFIVKACNNHTALVEALNKAQQDINWMLNNRQFLNQSAFDYIDAALAAVEGE